MAGFYVRMEKFLLDGAKGRFDSELFEEGEQEKIAASYGVPPIQNLNRYVE